jgi:hypothetical protein
MFIKNVEHSVGNLKISENWVIQKLVIQSGEGGGGSFTCHTQNSRARRVFPSSAGPNVGQRLAHGQGHFARLVFAPPTELIQEKRSFDGRDERYIAHGPFSNLFGIRTRFEHLGGKEKMK